jgi:citrate synthase
MTIAEVIEMPKTPETEAEPAPGKSDALSITDRRTGRVYEVPIADGTIRAMDLRQIKVNADDFGLMTYDPAFLNTASCKSRITFIDGDKGILRYRGYPIEQLAENCTYLEVAYLLLYGELPDRQQYQDWERNITFHTMIHESLKKFMDGFNYDAHPMGMLIATVGAMSTFYPDAHNIHDAGSRTKQTYRLIAKMPTLAAFAYRHSMGMPYVYPDNSLSYTENFLNMLFKMPSETYRPNPAIARALDVLFILHADHEQNCGTHVMRGIGSSHPDPYSAVAGAAAALYGPLHGGANEEVLKMLAEIGTKDRVPAFIKEVKEGKGDKRLMGFGHRVYKNYDPRARIIKKIADEVFEVTGPQPASRHRAGARAHRASGRLLHQAQALFQCGLLLGAHLPGDRHADRDVHGALRHPAHRGLDRAMGRDARRPRTEDRAAPAGLHRRRRETLRPDRQC